MKTLVLMLVASPVLAQTLTPAAVASTGIPAWVVILIIGGLAVGGFVYLKKKKPEAAASIEAGADKLKDSLTNLLHKQQDTTAAVVATNTQLATVVASPPVQAVVNAPAAVPAAAPVAAKQAAPTVAPGPWNNYGLPLEYISPDDPKYLKTGNEPSWGWVPVLRTQMFGMAGRTDPGNPGYVDGQSNIVPATEEQKALARRINAHVTQEDVTAAYAELLASAGTMDRVNAIINAYSTSQS